MLFLFLIMEFTKRYHYDLPIISLGQELPFSYWAVATTLIKRHEAFKQAVFSHLCIMSSHDIAPVSCLSKDGIKALQCYLDNSSSNKEIRRSMSEENFEQLCNYEAQQRSYNWHISSRGTGEVRCHWDDDKGFTAMQEEVIFVVANGEWMTRKDLYEEINSQEMLDFLKSIGASESDAFWMYQLY